MSASEQHEEAGMAARIVAIGEALVDVVQPAAGGGDPVEHPGGSPLNIAYGLARLGRAATLVTAVGDDERGRAVVEHVRSTGAVLDPVSFRDEPTSTATARLRAGGSADYVFDIRWSLPGPSELRMPAAELVHVGSLGAFVDPGGASVVEHLRALAQNETSPIIAFDPNMRPSIVTDHAAALERFAAIAGLSTLVKLSDEDAEWLYPGAGVDGAIDRILALGPVLVAVTRGGDGAVIATAADRVRVPGRAVEVVDTIGAGDSFMSALLHGLAGLLDEGTAPDALRDASALDRGTLERLGAFAVRCAAITVSRAGANPPTLAEARS
jgi:fructokinase